MYTPVYWRAGAVVSNKLHVLPYGIRQRMFCGHIRAALKSWREEKDLATDL
jgi:hypothetical protein